MNKVLNIIAVILIPIILMIQNHISLNINDLQATLFTIFMFFVIFCITVYTGKIKKVVAFIKSSIMEIKLIYWVESNIAIRKMFKLIGIIIITGIIVAAMDTIISSFIKSVLLS